MTDFAIMLVAAREKLKYSTETLAEELHVSRDDLISWLEGMSIPENPHVYELAISYLKALKKAQSELERLENDKRAKQIAKTGSNRQKYIVFPPEEVKNL